MMRRLKLRPPITQMLVVASASVSFSILFIAARGFQISPGYVTLCAALTLATACGIAVVATVLPWPGRSALAIWAALSAGLALHPLAGCVLGGLTFWALHGAGPASDARPTWGLAVALGLALSLSLLPRVANRLSFAQHQAVAAALAVALCAAVIGALVWWDRIQQSSARRPKTATVALAGLIAAAFLPYLFPQRGARVSFDNFHNDASTTSRPDIILLVLDTVRADHLSIYGYGRDTTPNLASFLAREPTAMVYPLAHSPATWTLPAHASLFTGELASQHTVRYFKLSEGSPLIANQLHARYTLAEQLGKQGYSTAFVYANSFLNKVRGFDRGFDQYLKARGFGKLKVVGEQLRRRWLPGEFPKEGVEHTSATVINQHVLGLLESCKGQPCFIVANYIEAHAPYAPDPPYAGVFSSGLSIPGDGDTFQWAANPSDSAEVVRYKEALYDEELLGLDAALGELLSQLQARGILDHAWLFITADHGEAFLEHGAGAHGTTIHSEVTRIPLIVSPPGETALPEAEGAVDLLDVTATIALLATGRSLGPGRDLRHRATTGRVVQIENYPIVGDLIHSTAVIDGSRKLISIAGRVELYDLSADPLEQEDLARDQVTLVRRLQALLPPVMPSAAGERHEALTLSDEEAAKLRVLGYLGR